MHCTVLQAWEAGQVVESELRKFLDSRLCLYGGGGSRAQGAGDTRPEKGQPGFQRHRQPMSGTGLLLRLQR